MTSERIQYLDGLRGVAILAVVLYHAYSRWNQVEPYEQVSVLSSIFSYGWLGVQLFFAISGYVIYRTIMRCNSILDFAVARYLRLAPAMIIASVLIYASSFIVTERPQGTPSAVDFIPSLTFIDPALLNKLTNWNVKSLDGAFWSLYIEVKFYFIVAIAFFVFKDKQLRVLMLLYLLWLTVMTLALFEALPAIVPTLQRALSYMGANHYGWFLLGVYAYKYEINEKSEGMICLMALAGVASATTKIGDVSTTMAAFTASLLFIVPMYNHRFRRIMSCTPLIFMGAISYPLYLIHQNIVTGLGIKWFNYSGDLPAFMYPLLPIVAVIGVSYLISLQEPLIKNKMRLLLPRQPR